MRKLFFVLLILTAQSAIAQRISHPAWEKYSWETSPRPYVLSAEEKKKSAVIIKDKRIIEIFFDQTGKSQDPFTYYTKHEIIAVNSDNAIETFNTVYIPMSGKTELVDLQARFISKSGAIITLNKASVKDVENYDNHGAFKIFALEGVEIGGVVEYLYTVKKPYEMYGTESFRSAYDYREISFDIYAPSHLKYDAKSYNGLPDPIETDNDDHKNLLQMNADSVAGFENEMYSAQDASYPRVEYKLAYNNSGGGQRKRMYTWSDAAEAYYRVLSDATPSERGMCDVLYKRMDISQMSSEEERIKKIESYLKTHITVREDASGDKYDRITGIIQTHLASEFGIMRLYYTLYDIAGIKREIVITSDRFNKQFDGEFDSWTYLQHFLLFFPNTKGYVAPSEQFARYSFGTPEWMSQDGLFIREVVALGAKSAVGSIKHIDIPDWKQSTYGMNVMISFDLEKGISNLHMNQTYVGFAGSFIQPYFPFLGLEDRQNAVKELLKNASTDAKPKNLVVTGYNSDDTLYYQPFSVTADYSTNSFLENTCDKYIFKVGEVIGTQVEMYQASERRSDMELQYPHSFQRIIKFEVPIGYRVTNLDALKMNVFSEDAGTRTMEFVSDYTQVGRIVTVTVVESYRQVHYPKSIYEEFRKVINASADFNKIVVYFEKDVN